MSDGDKPRKRRAARRDSFGSALGPDFVPLGRRIVIKSGKDHVKPKRRPKKSRNTASEPET